MSSETLSRRKPLNKQPSELLSITTAAQDYGGSPAQWRGRIARKQVPFRRLGGRIVLLRGELETFLQNLPGCTPAQITERARRENL
jgi:hypothetical protein